MMRTDERSCGMKQNHYVDGQNQTLNNCVLFALLEAVGKQEQRPKTILG